MSIPGSVNPLFLGAAGQATGGGEYQIERSVRFNSPDSAYLSRTPDSAGNRKTWTWAGWVKRSGLGRKNLFMSYDGSNLTEATYTNLQFSTADLLVFGSAFVTYRTTTQVFRDASAWYHLVIAVDTAQATANDRIKIYVNGTQITAFNTTNNPSLNADLAVNATFSHRLGSEFNQFYFDGCIADVFLIDGQALTPSDFGEFDTNGVWQPIDASGLTFGTNGFRLPFSDNSTAAALGTDTSSNGNTWTVNNLDHTEYTPFQKIDALGTVTSAGGYTLTNVVNAFDADTNFLGTTWSSSGTGYADTITWTPGSNITVPSGYNLYFAIYYKTTNNNNRFFRFTDANGTDGTEVAVSSSNMSATTNYWTDVTSALPTAEANGDRIFSAFRYRDTVAYSGQFPRWYSVVIATSPPDSYNAPSNVTYLIDNSLGNPVNTGCDSLVDSPVNGSQVDTGVGGEVVGNYCTLNAINTGGTLTNGNLDYSSGTGNTKAAVGTIAVSSGKWYWEVLCTGSSGTYANTFQLGIASISTLHRTTTPDSLSGVYIWYGYNGTKYVNGASGAYSSAYSVNDLIGFALDLIAGTLTCYKNGVSQGVLTSGLSGTFYPIVSNGNGSSLVTVTCNWGQRPFAYTAPSGFKALCTTNLPEPTIADGSTAMDVLLWTGTGTGADRTISGLNFTNAPGFIWGKSRSGAYHHTLWDVVRGYGQTNVLSSDRTEGEGWTASGRIKTAAASSITWEADSGSLWYDGSSTTYAAWCWDAGSSTVTNTEGSITSQVRANASAGFSVVTWTADTGVYSVGHGLGVKPAMIIHKRRDIGETWLVRHVGIGDSGWLILNSTAAASTLDYGGTNTSSVFYNQNAVTTTSGAAMVAYCFAPVAGYSAFGSYVGNANSDGPFIFTNFRPKLLLIKSSTTVRDWVLYDTSRSTYNTATARLVPNSSSAEGTSANIDILSNGFKIRSGSGSGFEELNESGATIVYAAWAENPFQSSRAR
jgi:hypothetical protein